jgi:hypothetical protein
MFCLANGNSLVFFVAKITGVASELEYKLEVLQTLMRKPLDPTPVKTLRRIVQSVVRFKVIMGPRLYWEKSHFVTYA